MYFIIRHSAFRRLQERHPGDWGIVAPDDQLFGLDQHWLNEVLLCAIIFFPDGKSSDSCLLSLFSAPLLTPHDPLSSDSIETFKKSKLMDFF